MRNGPYAKTYQDMLPLAARSGTLANRYVDTPFAGKLYAKTGSLTGVNSLSGYIDFNDGITFSVLSNGGTQPNSYIRGVIDKSLLEIYNTCK